MNWHDVLLIWLAFNAVVGGILLGGAHMYFRRCTRFYRLAVRS